MAVIADAARHDTGKVRKVRIDIKRHAVQRYPFFHANADGGNLVLATLTLFGPTHPNADAIVAALTSHIECGQAADDPFFQRGDEAANVRTAALEVEHHVSNPLAWSMVSRLAAATGFVEGETRVNHVGGACTGACGVERRVLQEPDKLTGATGRDVGSPAFHGHDSLIIGHGRIADAPFGSGQS